MAGDKTSRDVECLPMPSRNPLPLSATQEGQVREVFHERVKRYCTDEIRAFAECARGRTISVSFACREPNRAMNQCLKTHSTQAELDAAREEWFGLRRAKQREREQLHRRKAEQDAFVREWWGLPDKDEEVARREAEKLARPERIGGYASQEARRKLSGGGDGGGGGSGSGEGR